MKNRLLAATLLLLNSTLFIFSSCEREETVKLPQSATLNQIFAEMTTEYTSDFPFKAGIAIGVVKDGEVLTHYLHGNTKPLSDKQVSTNTLFPLASATKMLSTVAVMQLVESGKIRLDQPVRELFPNLPSTFQPITVKHLLAHADGIEDGFNHPNFAELSAQERENISRERYLQFASELPLRFQPGTQSQYGQTGFVLLSMIIEKVSGKKYEAYCKEKILRPLKMNDTHFTTTNTPIKDYMLEVYERDANSFKTVPLGYTYADYSTAAMTSSLEDLIKLMQGLQQYKLLNKNTIQQICTTTELSTSFGLGWEYHEVQGIVAAGHSGGQSVVLAYFPEQNAGVIFLSNISDEAILGMGYDVAQRTLLHLLQP